jgi:hypothetical protein
MILRSLAMTLLLSVSALAQPTPALQGSWTASAGPNQGFRGTWSAVVLPGTRNAGRGSWTLLNAGNQIVLRGQWSAQKTARGWHGTWSARILAGRSSPGRSFSGAWQAEMTGAENQTLAEMLQRAVEKQIAGSWRSGPRAGTWSLKSLQ